MSTVEFIAIVIAAAASFTDLKTARIPNVLTFSAALLAVMFHAVAPQGNGAAAAAAGLLAGLAVFFPMFALGALGAGDVKLMAALGAWLGWEPVIYVALYGALAGGALGVAFAMTRGYLLQAFNNIRALIGFWWVAGVRPMPALTLQSATALRMPYALPIAVGLVVTIWAR